MSFLLLLGLLGACGGNDARDKLQWGDSTPQDQRELFQSDLNYLDSVTLAANPELSALMGMPGVSPADFRAWLFARVHYIVSEDDARSDQENYLRPTDGAFAFPNGTSLTLLSSRGLSETRGSSETEGTVLAQNIGSAYYNLAKSSGRFDSGGRLTGEVYQFKIGDRWLALDSPRVGLIQIGDGLWKLGGKDTHSVASSIMRLSVLFHEARHGDGHGYSLGFEHVKCPSGHSYAGALACDISANGAYTVGAKFLKALIENCVECDARQIQHLKLFLADQMDRLLPKYDAVDDQLQTVQKQLDTLNVIRETGNVAAQKKRETLLNLQSFLAKIKNEGAVDWDAAPERAEAH